MQYNISELQTPPKARYEGRLVRPLRLALIIAGAYLAVTVPYILISGKIAAHISKSVLDLQTIESLKGTVFVVTTSGLLFILCFGLFKRIARRERELAQYRAGIIAAERRAAAGLFASSVAHDMNNVLTIIECATEALGRGAVSENTESLADLREANNELKKLSEVLGRSIGRNLASSIVEFDLAASLRDTTALARTHKKVSYCTLAIEGPTTLPFRGIPVQIHQALLNLILNAADATDHRGEITIELTPSDTGAVIAVHDNGLGVGENERQSIMEPFVTTKSDGSGLGLLSVKVCAESHNGHVEITSSHLGGACFRIHLQNLCEVSAATSGSSRAPARANQRQLASVG